MSHSRFSLRRIKLAAAASLAAAALVLTPGIAATAQADDPPTPFYLYTTWALYSYQVNKVPLFGQSDTIQADVNALAVQYASCSATCFYKIPTLPGLNSGTTLFFAKTGWRALPNTDTEPYAVAHSIEATAAGSYLLNPYYNYGGVGTVTKGDTVYSVFLMTHYLVLTPAQHPAPIPE
jgi:hypothetical protein